MKIGIIGSGYVGLTTGICLASLEHNIFINDVDKEKLKKIQPTKIYFSQDGPRMNSNDDLTKCIEVRNYVIKNINWIVLFIFLPI